MPFSTLWAASMPLFTLRTTIQYLLISGTLDKWDARYLYTFARSLGLPYPFRPKILRVNGTLDKYVVRRLSSTLFLGPMEENFVWVGHQNDFIYIRKWSDSKAKAKVLNKNQISQSFSHVSPCEPNHFQHVMIIYRCIRYYVLSKNLRALWNFLWAFLKISQ